MSRPNSLHWPSVRRSIWATQAFHGNQTQNAQFTCSPARRYRRFGIGPRRCQQLKVADHLRAPLNEAHPLWKRPSASRMKQGQVHQGEATAEGVLPGQSAAVWFTDPPYYDAVPYADLSDFFFVWLKRALPAYALPRDPFDPYNPLSPKSGRGGSRRNETGGRPIKGPGVVRREDGECFCRGSSGCSIQTVWVL